MGDWWHCGGQIWDTFAQFMKAQKPPGSHTHTCTHYHYHVILWRHNQQLLTEVETHLWVWMKKTNSGGDKPGALRFQLWLFGICFSKTRHLGESEPPSGYQEHSPVWPVSIPVVESLFFTLNRTKVILVTHSSKELLVFYSHIIINILTWVFSQSSLWSH